MCNKCMSECVVHVCDRGVNGFAPLCLCDQELDVKAGGGCVMTIGEMLRSFLTKLEWFSTLFPRIPVPVQKAIDQHMKSRPRKAPQKEEQDEEEAADSGRHADRRRSRYICCVWVG
ncbi:hypothetical protein M9458_004750 [Cirrhinus mrigala]|uniref:Uncharacterized protein n=1 Tax=Cirrhinus mrigala TaxID=683832 RepID=A0ABD0RSP2_CIRMR